MNWRHWVFSVAAFLVTSSIYAVDVKSTDIFTATTRIDTQDWSSEPLALSYPGAVLAGEDELWVTELNGAIWHVNTVTGAKTLLGNKEAPGNVLHGLNLIARLGDHEIVVPYGELNGNTEFSHVVIDLETNERRAFKNLDTVNIVNSDLIGLPNGNLLAKGFNSSLVIFDGAGQTLVKTDSLPEPVRGFASHPDGRIIGIATAADLSGSKLVEIDPETAAASPFVTLPGILPTRLAIAPDGTYYVAQREDDDEFTLSRIDGLTFEVSQVPLSADDFELGLEFDLDVDNNGTILITATDLRTRRSFGLGYSVILGIDPDTFETSIVVGGYSLTVAWPGFMSMGQDDALYFTINQGGDHRVLRQDLMTGGITIVTSNKVDDAVIDAAAAIAVDGDDVWVINHEGAPDWEHLVHVDRQTGEQTMLGSFGARLFVQQMLVDPTDGSLLLATWGATAESFRAILRVVPQENPVFERINPVPLPGNPMFFDIAPDGSLVIYVAGNNESVLYRMDPITGDWEMIGDRVLPANYTNPLVVLNDGTIVARGYRDNRTRIILETIDPESGEGTEVFDTPPGTTTLIRLPRDLTPANMAPEVTIIGGDRTIPDSDLAAGELVSFTATSSDSDGTVESTQWLVDEEVVASGSEVDIFLPDGATLVSVRVTDDDGASTTTSATITVVAMQDEGWPVPYNGVTPDPEIGLEFNNIGFFNSEDQLLYACVRIMANGEPSSVDGIERFDIIFDNFAVAGGTINIVNARDFNPFSYLNEDEQTPDCSGEFETSTGVYSDIVQDGPNISSVMYQLLNPELLLFSALGKTLLYSDLPSADPASLNGVTLTLPAVRVGDATLEVLLELTTGSDPIQFVLTGATEVPDVGLGASVFDAGILYIPSVVVGEADYRVELLLINESPITFQLHGAFLN